MGKLLLHRTHRVRTSAGRLSYLMYVPPGSFEERLPVLLFLHGSEERGDDITRVATHGIPHVVERGRNLPCVCVSPQCPADRAWTDLTPALLEVLHDVGWRLTVDPERVYLTGISMGGFGVWKLAAEAPERFAALVPVCGGGDPRWAPRLRSLPTWAFHGLEDDVVGPSSTVDMVRALEQVGAPVRLTLYEGVGHDSWTRTYDDPALYDWLFAQHRQLGEVAQVSASP